VSKNGGILGFRVRIVLEMFASIHYKKLPKVAGTYGEQSRIDGRLRSQGLKAPTAGQLSSPMVSSPALGSAWVPVVSKRTFCASGSGQMVECDHRTPWSEFYIGPCPQEGARSACRCRAGQEHRQKGGRKRKGSKGVGTVAELYETYLAQQIEGKKRSARSSIGSSESILSPRLRPARGLHYPK
jgi:hypothetical protein